MKLVYFAWVRERIGKDEENVQLPDRIQTVRDLTAWLRTLGEEYKYAFENESIVRAAVDHVHVKPSAIVRGANEVAFFPPMTGG